MRPRPHHLPALLIAVALGWPLGAGAGDLIVDFSGSAFTDGRSASPVPGNPARRVGEQRQNAVLAAAERLGVLTPNVDVVIQVSMEPLQCDDTGFVLGYGGTTTTHKDFPDRPRDRTLYSAALANNLAGFDINGRSAEIDIVLNSSLGGTCNVNWYYGTDRAPRGTISLYNVARHEIVHGLGFQSFVDTSDGTRFNGTDDQMMPFLFDVATQQTWTDLSARQRKTSAVSNNLLHWIGPGAANAAWAENRESLGPRMHAPRARDPGGSVSHFRERDRAELMEASLTHTVSDTITQALLHDLGWEHAELTAPVLRTGFLDLDDDGVFRPLIDGLLIVRHLFGFRRGSLTDGFSSADAATVDAFMAANGQMLDVDGNGVTDALTDGLLLLRAGFGFRDGELTDGATGDGATRRDSAVVQDYIDRLISGS